MKLHEIKTLYLWRGQWRSWPMGTYELRSCGGVLGYTETCKKLSRFGHFEVDFSVERSMTF